jgi:hypothetical protein
LHYQPPALLVAKIEFRHDGGLGGLLVGRLNGPKILPVLPDDLTRANFAAWRRRTYMPRLSLEPSYPFLWEKLSER